MVMDRLLKCFPYKDKPSIIGTLIYQRFALKLSSMLNASLVPEADKLVYA